MSVYFFERHPKANGVLPRKGPGFRPIASVEKGDQLPTAMGGDIKSGMDAVVLKPLLGI